MAIGLGISRRDSWHVREDMSARISLEVAVTNGFSYLSRVTREAAVSTGEIEDKCGNLHCRVGRLARA